MLRAAILITLALADPALAAEKPKRGNDAAALDSPDRLVQIGNHARASSDFLLALSFYERALGIDPGHAPALRAATEVALALRLPQAHALAERWVSKAPRDGLAHLAVGAALVQQNRPTEAEKAFALAAAAGGPPAAIAVQRGLAFDLLGQSRSAQLAFADAMQQTPGDRSIVEYLALSLAIGGEDAAAIELLRPEADRASGQPSFERTLALVHALGGRVDIARRIAATSMPQSAEAVGDLLQRVAALTTPAERAAAVHLGIIPDARAVAPPPPQPPVVTVRESSSAAPRQVPPPAAASPPTEVTKAPVVAAPAAPKPPQPRPETKEKPEQRAEAQVKAKPEPMPPGMKRLTPAQLKAEHVWLQIASSIDRAALNKEHAKLKKKAAGMLDRYNAYVQTDAGNNRLLVGPFQSMGHAMKAAARLKAGGLSALPNRLPAGSSITPL